MGDSPTGALSSDVLEALLHLWLLRDDTQWTQHWLTQGMGTSGNWGHSLHAQDLPPLVCTSRFPLPQPGHECWGDGPAPSAGEKVQHRPYQVRVSRWIVNVTREKLNSKTKTGLCFSLWKSTFPAGSSSSGPRPSCDIPSAVTADMFLNFGMSEYPILYPASIFFFLNWVIQMVQ